MKSTIGVYSAPESHWVGAAERRAIPWWLWWNVLSIDAPAVALAWAVLFAHASGIRLPAAEAEALVLSVWIIYTGDRLLDGWSAKDHAVLQERHLFCEQHRFVLVVSVAAASGLVLWLMGDGALAAQAIAGVKLGFILVLYMAVIHAGGGRIARVLPKEVAVGLLFAVGVTLPIWTRRTGFSWRECLVWGFFSLLCSLNCLSIECWENHRRGAGWRQPPHPFVRWAEPGINRFAAALAAGALVAGLVGDVNGPSQTVLFATGGGALLLLLLGCIRTRCSPSELRVLADAGVLVPALVALMMEVGKS
jgi:hypothetical protein